MKNLLKSNIILLLVCLTGLFSCKKDHFTTDSSAKLAFSSNLILYDTVFSTVGSVTKTFIVYNRHSLPIKISTIRLARGAASNFRINVDGSKGTEFSDVEIAGKDSLFVFAEVTVDPNNQSTPLVIRDSVVFDTNGNVQDVDLEAWGKDAYFHTPNVFPTNGLPPYLVIPCSATWKNDKPHVIYGYAVVDSGCTLNITQGAKIYMHPGSVLWVYRGGTLKINGDITQPVIFQGDRLEPEYQEGAGQWGYIWLSPLSKNNSVNWAIIKNGTIGIVADTMAALSTPTLDIKNSIIKNMSVAALYGRGASIVGSNCVFANCGQYVAALTLGGMYNFYHCTFVNYWNNSTRQFPVLLLNNYYKDVNDNVQSRPLDSAYFYNCIIYGDIPSGDEIKLDQSTNTSFPFSYKFHNSLLKTTFNTSASAYENIIANAEPYFYDVATNDYRIKNPLAFPAVIDKGDPAIGFLFPDDLRGKPRMVNGNPDIGAYEYEP